MPGLPRQAIDIPIGSIETSVDSKLVKPGSLLELENGYSDKMGRLAKRGGYEQAVITLADTDKQLENTTSMFSFTGDDLYVVGLQENDNNTFDEYDGDRCFIYDSGEDNYIDTGRLEAMNLEMIDAGSARTHTVSAYEAINGDLRCVVREISGEDALGDWDNYATVSIYNIETDICLVDDYIFATFAQGQYGPKVVAVGDSFHIWSYNLANTRLSLTIIDIDDPTTIPAPVPKINDSADYTWDVCTSVWSPTAADCSVVVHIDLFGDYQLSWWHETGALLNTEAGWVADSTGIAIGEIVDKSDDETLICLVWEDTNWLRYRLLHRDGTNQLATFAFLNVGAMGATGAHLHNATFIAETSRTEEDITMFVNLVDLSTTEFTTYFGHVDIVGSMINFCETMPFTQLNSRTWLRSGRAHAGVLHHIKEVADVDAAGGEESEQKAYFIVTAEGTGNAAEAFNTVTSTAFYRGKAREYSFLVNGLPVVCGDEDPFNPRPRQFPIIKQETINTESIKVVAFTEEVESLPRKRFQNYGISGGGLAYLPGSTTNDLGHLLAPEIMSLSQFAGVNTLVNGTYLYTAIYQWSDAQGNIYRSTPATPVPITLAGANDSVHVTVSCLRYGSIPKLEMTQIEIYRTQVDLNIFRKIENITFNDPIGVTGTVTVDDEDTDDAELLEQPLLYTEGGVLFNWSTQPFKLITSNPERIFITPQEEPRKVVYSKTAAQGIGVEFTSPDIFSVTLDTGGDITGLEILGEQVIIFKENHIYSFYGLGPDALGRGTFTPPVLISNTVGCIDPGSILSTDAGIIFRSNIGIYMLNKNLTVQNIGMPVVDHYTDNTIKKTFKGNNQTLVYFFMDNHEAIIYDIISSQWSLYTNHEMVDVVEYNGILEVITSDNWRHTYTPGVFLDGLTSITFKIITPWIRLQGLQGFQRLYWVNPTGEYLSDHTLNIRMYHNYKAAVHETKSKAQTGVAGEPLIFRYKPAKQKNTAVKFEIWDSDQDDSEESFNLTALSLVIGKKKFFGHVKYST